jgi:capsular exopolysaccharide synthesis family protein
MPGNLAPAVRSQRILLDPSSDAAEAYRALRTAVHFGVPADRSKTILVTSPTPADGKSTLCSNLAIAMAQAGKRVLLVDADLRHPRQHEAFGVENATGLSGVLGASEIPFVNAIQPTQIGGLDILPCGPRPDNPSELLNSQRFIEVLEELADAYDHVLIDSPPVMMVTDARIVAASCDVTLLVVRQSKANRRMCEMSRDGLASVGANVLGIVLNDVPRHSQFYGGYGDAAYYYSNPKGAAKAAREIRATRPPTAAPIAIKLTVDPAEPAPGAPAAANGKTNGQGHAGVPASPAVTAAAAAPEHDDVDPDPSAVAAATSAFEAVDDGFDDLAETAAAESERATEDAAAAAASPAGATQAEKMRDLALRAKELRSARRL